MKRIALLVIKALFFVILFSLIYQMVNSSLDIYNNFAYDKAVLRYTPYGYVPLLDNPNDYRSSNADVKGGDFVYVENWESADNGSIVFAKVRSKLSTGYVNRRMLVEANINVMPIISVLILSFLIVFAVRKIYLRIHNAY
ncbi:MAG TPA: hypothetical protein PKE39_06680 [Ignavibacteria bacterium]|nr:hypothetical protein [Ignavibacteria bacterium]HMQ98694.1 hypothetical protein [Ignavibacteria bacterium]